MPNQGCQSYLYNNIDATNKTYGTINITSTNASTWIAMNNGTIVNDASCNFNFVGNSSVNNQYNEFYNYNTIINNGTMSFGYATDFIIGPIRNVNTILYNGSSLYYTNSITNNGTIYCNDPVSTYFINEPGATISGNYPEPFP
jgi:hypothetical protein